MQCLWYLVIMYKLDIHKEGQVQMMHSAKTACSAGTPNVILVRNILKVRIKKNCMRSRNKQTFNHWSSSGFSFVWFSFDSFFLFFIYNFSPNKSVLIKSRPSFNAPDGVKSNKVRLDRSSAIVIVVHPLKISGGIIFANIASSRSWLSVSMG